MFEPLLGQLKKIFDQGGNVIVLEGKSDQFTNLCKLFRFSYTCHGLHGHNCFRPISIKAPFTALLGCLSVPHTCSNFSPQNCCSQCLDGVAGPFHLLQVPPEQHSFPGTHSGFPQPTVASQCSFLPRPSSCSFPPRHES